MKKKFAPIQRPPAREGNSTFYSFLRDLNVKWGGEILGMSVQGSKWEFECVSPEKFTCTEKRPEDVAFFQARFPSFCREMKTRGLERGDLSNPRLQFASCQSWWRLTNACSPRTFPIIIWPQREKKEKALCHTATHFQTSLWYRRHRWLCVYITPISFYVYTTTRDL